MQKGEAEEEGEPPPFFPIPYPFRRLLRRLVSADTEGAIESVRIKRIEFRENVRAFFPQGQTKLA